MKLRSITALLLAIGVAACAPADDAASDMDDAADATDVMDDDPTIAPDGPATGLPAGYAVRLDRDDASADDFHVEDEGGAMMIRTGPAGFSRHVHDASRMTD